MWQDKAFSHMVHTHTHSYAINTHLYTLTLTHTTGVAGQNVQPYGTHIYTHTLKCNKCTFIYTYTHNRCARTRLAAMWCIHACMHTHIITYTHTHTLICNKYTFIHTYTHNKCGFSRTVHTYMHAHAYYLYTLTKTTVLAHDAHTYTHTHARNDSAASPKLHVCPLKGLCSTVFSAHICVYTHKYTYTRKNLLWLHHQSYTSAH